MIAATIVAEEYKDNQKEARLLFIDTSTLAWARPIGPEPHSKGNIHKE
jgi:hypothetical protein